MSNKCWKCNDREGNDHFGLCYNCAESLMLLGGLIGYLLVCVFVYLFVLPVFEPSASGFSKFIISPLVALLGIIFIAIGSVFLYRASSWVFGWIKAISGYVIVQHNQKLQSEAIERAKLANPQHLNGQQLDALLTEQHKEKMGWK